MKNKKIIGLIVVLGAVLFSVFFAWSELVRSESVKNHGLASVVAVDFAEVLKNDDPVLIDVRTPEEYKAEHLPGAININFNSEDFVSSIRQMDRSRLYAIYCRSGSRSKDALEVMERKGFENVVELTGGIQAWPADDLTEDHLP